MADMSLDYHSIASAIIDIKPTISTMLWSPGSIRMVSHDGVVEEEVEAEAEEGEEEEEGEQKPGGEIG